MSGSDTGRLVVSASKPGTTFRLFDGSMRLVGWDRDHLNAEVPAGVYQLEARLGDSGVTRLLMIRPGEQTNREINVDFRAAAPVSGLSSTSKSHTEFAMRLSERLIQDVGPSAGLGLVLRNMNDELKSSELRLRVDTVELLDSHLNPVPNTLWPGDWIFGADSDIAGMAKRLQPGPYVLRTRRASMGDDNSIVVQEETVDQTIWLADNYQTLVFMENQSFGADARGMSVQMAPIRDIWQADAEDSLALEAVLAGLQSGHDCVSLGALTRLANSDLINPMYAIASLHGSLLGQHAPKPHLLVSLIGNLVESVGNHPDVLALAAGYPAVGGPGSIRPGFFSVPWPPMLDRSYRSFLLNADLSDENLLPQYSPAERVAPFLRIPGPWLQWTATDEILVEGVQPAETGVWAKDDFRWYSVDLPQWARPRNQAPAAAVRQVDDGINELAEFNNLERQQLVEELGTAELAQRLRLPETLVRSALTELGVGIRSGDPIRSGYPGLDNLEQKPMAIETGKTLRLALAMRGGVSLAVWIGGAVAELDLFRRACNGAYLGPDPKGFRSDRATIYRQLLSETKNFGDVEIDILAGASAGGLNAVLFGLAQTCDAFMDDIVHKTWIEKGGIWDLLREPGFGRVPSILKGDERLFSVVRDALGEIAGENTVAPPGVHLESKGEQPAPAGRRGGTDRVTVELAATLLDDVSNPDRSSRARFSFVKTPGDLESCYSTIPGPNDVPARPPGTAPGDDDKALRCAQWRIRSAIDRMALAARATSSFPGAFEPAAIYSVSSGTTQPGQSAPLPPDYITAEQTGVNMARAFLYSRTQGTRPDPFNVVDGGIFDNIPIDRAIRAIERAPATRPSERFLIYLDPEPPDKRARDTDSQERSSAVSWIPVIHRSFTLKQRNETEDDELGLIREHNDSVMEIRGRLEALAAIMRELRRAVPNAVTATSEFVETLITDESYLQCRIAMDGPRIGRLLTSPDAELCYPPREAVDYVPLAPSEAVKIRTELIRLYNDPLVQWQLPTDIYAMLDWARILIAWVHALEELFNDYGRAVVEELPPLPGSFSTDSRRDLARNLERWKPRLYRWLTVLIEAKHRTVDEILAFPLRSDQPNPRTDYPWSERLQMSRGFQLALRLTPEFTGLLMNVGEDGQNLDAKLYDLLASSNRFFNPGDDFTAVVTEGLNEILTIIRTESGPVIAGLLEVFEGYEQSADAPNWLAYWAKSVFPHFYLAPLGGFPIERLSRLFAVTGVPDTAAIIDYGRITSKEFPEIAVPQLKDAEKARHLQKWLRRLPRDDEPILRVLTGEKKRLEPGSKLAGNVLMRFGGFFKWQWRENDWQWGRLDAAAGLVKLLIQLRRQAATPGDEDNEIDPTAQSDRIARTETLQSVILEESIGQSGSAVVRSVGAESFDAVSYHYRFALASRILPLVCRALWPAKASPFSVSGAGGRLGSILMRPLAVPLALAADPLRVALAALVICGSASLLGTGSTAQAWRYVMAGVFGILGAAVGARAWKTAKNWRQLRKRLQALDPQFPQLEIDSGWVEPILDKARFRRYLRWSRVLAAVVIGVGIALVVLPRWWPLPCTVESFVVAVLFVLLLQHWLNQRAHHIGAQGKSATSLRIGMWILAGIASIAVIAGSNVLVRYQPESWWDNPPITVAVAGIAVALLICVSVWGWVRNSYAVGAIAASLLVGGIAQWAFDNALSNNGRGWDLLPPLVWIVVLGAVIARLPCRPERYGEEAKPDQLKEGPRSHDQLAPARNLTDVLELGTPHMRIGVEVREEKIKVPHEFG